MILAIIAAVTMFAILTISLIRHPVQRKEAKEGYLCVTMLCLFIAAAILVAQFVIIKSGDRFKTHEMLEEHEAYPVRINDESEEYSVMEYENNMLCAIISKNGELKSVRIDAVVVDESISSPVVRYIKHKGFKNFSSLILFYPIPYKAYTLYLPTGGDTNA